MNLLQFQPILFPYQLYVTEKRTYVVSRLKFPIFYRICFQYPLIDYLLITKEMTLKELTDEEFGEAWGEIQKVWFDPKRYWNPAKLENVVELKMFWNKTPRNIKVGLDKLGQDMPNLEALSIYQAHGRQLKLEMILSFKNLKRLYVNLSGVALSGLVDMLHTLENIKNLDLCISISTERSEDFDEKQAKDIFQQAFEIIDKNFPRKSAIFSISNDKYDLLLTKSKDKAPKRKIRSKHASKTVKRKPPNGKIFSDSDEDLDENDDNLQWDPTLKIWVKHSKKLAEYYPDYARSRQKAGHILMNNGDFPKRSKETGKYEDFDENAENLAETNEKLGEDYENSSSENTYESDEDSEADSYDNRYYRDSMEDLYSDGNDGPANIEVGSMKMWSSSEDENSDTNEIEIDENSDTDEMIGQE